MDEDVGPAEDAAGLAAALPREPPLRPRRIKEALLTAVGRSQDATADAR